MESCCLQLVHSCIRPQASASCPSLCRLSEQHCRSPDRALQGRDQGRLSPGGCGLQTCKPPQLQSPRPAMTAGRCSLRACCQRGTSCRNREDNHKERGGRGGRACSDERQRWGQRRRAWPPAGPGGVTPRDATVVALRSAAGVRIGGADAEGSQLASGAQCGRVVQPRVCV